MLDAYGGVGGTEHLGGVSVASCSCKQHETTPTPVKEHLIGGGVSVVFILDTSLMQVNERKEG